MPGTRPAAALAMDEKAADAVLKPAAKRRLAQAVDLSPTVLTDFTTAEARTVLARTRLLITGWGCPPLDAEALAHAPGLRAVVHTAGSVRGHVTQACWARGIEVSTAAAANAAPVAEYTLAMILLANKRVLPAARAYRERRSRGEWLLADPTLGNYRRTVGILSASLVGRRVMELLRPHDLRVLLHDPYVTEEQAAALGAVKAGLPQVFAASDVVSVHTPLLPATRGLVGGDLLALLRDGATLINTARGAVLDQDALTDQVRRGRLNAVLDVTEPEVLPAGHPLWECDNALLTPHLAGSQGNELDRLAESAVQEVFRWAAGERFAHAVRPEHRNLLA
ncbi:hydroxyacid dehydrogenase [Streptomyces albus subsp. chlorinus]|uniref:hydroxyacid dehydrogenase n=1 Tax=Streptomyces albus TaxID=1888 RepID=UPI0015704767|nr:hydroxyacid dehydrogenase [Streptomyces albus]NSC21408.1 hydroxyacid dehydrogenase [Streptomyces albus subsp. chlorinus]